MIHENWGWKSLWWVVESITDIWWVLSTFLQSQQIRLKHCGGSNLKNVFISEYTIPQSNTSVSLYHLEYWIYTFSWGWIPNQIPSAVQRSQVFTGDRIFRIWNLNYKLIKPQHKSRTNVSYYWRWLQCHRAPDKYGFMKIVRPGEEIIRPEELVSWAEIRTNISLTDWLASGQACIITQSLGRYI